MSLKIKALIRMMSGLPGLGPASARRIAIHLITNRHKTMLPISELMKDLVYSVIECEKCMNIDTISPCSICSDSKRDQKTLCVVGHISDIWAFERCQSYNGLYHVLGGLLSAGDNMTPEKLNIELLIRRVIDFDISEVIIATGSNMSGQVTAGYIATELQTLSKAKITRLACGIPIGGEIDYTDDSTLKAAISLRREML